LTDKPEHALRLEAIDVARGLAALSVAVYHHGFGVVLAEATGIRAFALLSWPGSTIAVPVFFVISGFCIHMGNLGRPPGPGFIRRFFILRFFRIYPPWLFAVLLSALVLWVYQRPPTGREMLLHLTLTNSLVDNYQMNAALWSVSVEWFLYALYPFWLAIRWQRGLATACAFAAAVSAISSIVTARLVGQPTGPAMWFFLNVWCGWVAGAALAEICHARQDSRPLFGAVWWTCGVIAWSLHGLCHYLGGYNGLMSYAYLPVTIILCIWPVAGLIQLGSNVASAPSILRVSWRTLARIGVFSYSLYLIHMPLQTVRFSLNDRLTGLGAKGLLFVAWFGLILGVAWLCHRWIEAPSARFGRRLAGPQLPAVKPLPVPQPS
jgi:peptidoglycan/LPS O-acetylase OafA/YrhL